MIIQMDLLRAHGIRPTASPSYYKYLMFRSCRNFFLSYLLLTATADVFTIGMHRRSPWIPHLLTELVEMMLIIGFGHTLRQRQYSPYTHMENGDNLPNTNGEGQGILFVLLQYSTLQVSEHSRTLILVAYPNRWTSGMGSWFWSSRCKFWFRKCTCGPCHSSNCKSWSTQIFIYGHKRQR